MRKFQEFKGQSFRLIAKLPTLLGRESWKDVVSSPS